MKTFGLSVLAAIGAYLVGLFGGMVLIKTFSSNTHDKSVEAAMTGAFVFGPLAAVFAVITLLIFRSRHSPTDQYLVCVVWQSMDRCPLPRIRRVPDQRAMILNPVRHHFYGSHGGGETFSARQ
jgi:hypothetical protein